MNYNVLTYLFYIAIILFVVIYVGAALYNNGIHFLINTFKGDKVIATAVNKFLLAGYYLINLGYSIIVLRIWEKVSSVQALFEALSEKVGGIVLCLGIMHLFNITVLIFIGKKKHHTDQSINN